MPHSVPPDEAEAVRRIQQIGEFACTFLDGHLRMLAGAPSKRRSADAEYLIELSGRQIVAMGGTLGAAGLISAELDVTPQVRDGRLQLS
jgi:hypothetical protein